MSLEYRQNINYNEYRTEYTNIDEQLLQLAQELRQGVHDVELYDSIRKKIYKDIKINELAVTIVLTDLMQIRQFNPRAFNIIIYYIVNNMLSYRHIAKKFRCSRQNVYQVLKRMANKYRWLKNLMQIKGEQDKRNDNNRINNMKQ